MDDGNLSSSYPAASFLGTLSPIADADEADSRMANTAAVVSPGQQFSRLIPTLRNRISGFQQQQPITGKESSDSGEIESDSDTEEQETSASSAGAPQLPKVEVRVVVGKRTSQMKLLPALSVQEAIRSILDEFGIAETDQLTAADFRLCKMSRATIGSDNRVWLEPSTTLSAAGIRPGDELRLRNNKQKYVVQVTKPPTTTIYSFTYDFSTPVKSALTYLLKDSGGAAQLDKFGLYYPMKGVWLDDSRTMESYDIDPTHTIELRTLSQEFLLKISAPDSTNQVKITLKVIRSQTVGEVVQMIHRKVSIENSSQFSLYYPPKGIWLDEKKTLEEYQIEPKSLVEFKSKFRALYVITPDDVAAAGDGIPSPSEFLVDYRATAEDVINFVGVSMPSFEEESHSLYYQYGTLIPPETLVQDIPMKEILEYRVTPWPVSVSPDYDPAAKNTFDINPSEPLSNILPHINRFFGVRQANFVELQLAKSRTPMNLSMSLFEQNIGGAELFVLKTDGFSWEPRSSSNAVTEDTDIWDEPSISSSNVVYEATAGGEHKKDIAQASLNKLIERLTDDKMLDLDFAKTFLLTYHSFTSSHILMKKMLERYHVPRPKNTAFEDFEANIKRPIQLRVVNVLKIWIETFASDFLDENNEYTPLALEVLHFCTTILAHDDPKLAKRIMNVIQKAKEGYRLRGTAFDALPPPPKLTVKKNPKLFDYPSEEIARQLTLIDFEMFEEIRPWELLGQAWNKKDAETRSPNVLKIGERFNRTTMWVVSSILAKHQIQQRIHRMTLLIELADHLLKLKNFATVMAFVAGFNNAAIQRLKFTRSEMPSSSQKKLEELESRMSAEGSYKAYRALLRQSDPPLVPYIGIYLADLTFIDDGNPNLVDGLINFSKRRLDYSVISFIQMYQNKPFNFIEVKELRNLLLDFPPATDMMEKALYDTSLKVEPRGAERNAIQ